MLRPVAHCSSGCWLRLLKLLYNEASHTVINGNGLYFIYSCRNEIICPVQDMDKREKPFFRRALFMWILPWTLGCIYSCSLIQTSPFSILVAHWLFSHSCDNCMVSCCSMDHYVLAVQKNREINNCNKKSWEKAQKSRLNKTSEKLSDNTEDIILSSRCPDAFILKCGILNILLYYASEVMANKILHLNIKVV